jgi:hypothetical protein
MAKANPLKTFSDDELIDELKRRLGYECDNDGQILIYTDRYEEGWN